MIPVLLAGSAAPAQSPQQPATREAQQLPSLAPLVDSVKAAVINVEVQSRVEMSSQEEAFEQFFGRRNPNQGREQLRQGAGSGFIIDAKGIAVTNNHVVQGAVNIQVRLDDGRSFDAEVIGRDPATDVAVIQLKGKVDKLPFVRLGDSDAVRVGDWALAIGNPFGLASSVSLGIISAKARSIRMSNYDDFLQTDAAINPGNSGGPLFSMKGEVIGMNTAITPQGGGIGFSVPSNLIKSLLPQLQEKGSVTRGYLGVMLQDFNEQLASGMGLPIKDGALVATVNDGSPAQKGGVRVDDVVTAIDGTKVNSRDALTRMVALKRPGSTVTLQLWRDGKQQDVKVQLGTRPDFEGEGPGPQRKTPEPDVRQQKIGLTLDDVDPRIAQRFGIPPEGAMIVDVVPLSPADKADLRPGMIVVEAAKKKIKRKEELLQVLKGAKTGETVLLRVGVPGDGTRFLRALKIP